MLLTTSHLGGYLGSGVSFVDFNGDGFDDLTFGHHQGDLKFYIGDGEGYSEIDLEIDNGGGEVKGIAWVDMDNDSDLDLFITYRLSSNQIWLNEGMSFTDISSSCGISQTSNSRSYGMSFGDYNNDGFIDFYICNYHTLIDAMKNELYLNNGDCTFTETTEIAGVGNGYQQTFQSTFIDINNDGFLDLHVINDRVDMYNAFYINNGDGTFEDQAVALNLDLGIYAMSSSFGDFDRDGDMDLYVTNGSDGNHLLQNQILDGSGEFVDVTMNYGVGEYKLCWAADWIDYNNDTYLDLYVASGLNVYSDYPEIAETFPAETNSLYINEGMAPFYSSNEEVPQWPQHTFAIAQGDFNNDGFPDLVSHKLGDYAQLLMSTPNNNYWLKIKLKGTTSNSMGIGCSIQINCIDPYENTIFFKDIVIAGENYLGQNSYWQHFGLKNISIVESITITWSGGVEETFNGPFEVNSHIELTEGGSDEVNPDDEIFGCTYSGACNFQEEATNDDGSCDLICLCGAGTIWDEESSSCIDYNPCPSDIDQNGQTDVDDLLMILIDYGLECPE